MRDAVISAITLNIFNNHCEKIKMANVAQLCNNLHALFLAGGENCITTPTYHVFDMFKGHQGAEAIRSIVENNDDSVNKISVSASVKDGKLTVTIANYSCTEAAEVDVNILGGVAVGKTSVTVLSGERINSCNTFDEPDRVAPTYRTIDDRSTVTVPAAGVIMFETRVN